MKRWLAPLLCGVFVSTIGLPVRAAESKDELEVRATLERLFNAYAAKDMATIEKIFHDDVSYGHSTGLVQSKAEVMKGAGTMLDVKSKEIHVYVNGPVAIVRSVLDIRTGQTMEKSTMNLGIKVLWVLLKGPRGWQVIARQAVRVAS
jgi:ketosteroid isomerase-like protein